MPRLALKVDVDTDRGTREGVPNLLLDLAHVSAPACFLFSLGPDQTGRAITRVFRPGFFKKVSRTSVLEIYGLRTLLNGTLLPAPHIGQKNTDLLRAVRDEGYEVGIHCHNHYRWQDYVQKMTLKQVVSEFGRARAEFLRIFGYEAKTAGAAGWQSTAYSREVYDHASLAYSSDTRGTAPFYPRIGERVFSTLEIPSTLPTLDELMGRPEFPDELIPAHLISLLHPTRLNVFTLHAEIEGMGRRKLFQDFLARAQSEGVEFVRLDTIAATLHHEPVGVPTCDQVMAKIEGRSGLVATQA